MKRARKHKPSDDGKGDDIFSEGEKAPGNATITHGPYAEQVPVAGMTVGMIRKKFSDRYNIPEDSLAMLDGEQVTDDSVVQEAQVLTFMHRANSKGLGC
jgi:hypothetical protein